MDAEAAAAAALGAPKVDLTPPPVAESAPTAGPAHPDAPAPTAEPTPATPIEPGAPMVPPRPIDEIVDSVSAAIDRTRGGVAPASTEPVSSEPHKLREFLRDTSTESKTVTFSPEVKKQYVNFLSNHVHSLMELRDSAPTVLDNEMFAQDKMLLSQCLTDGVVDEAKINALLSSSAGMITANLILENQATLVLAGLQLDIAASVPKKGESHRELTPEEAAIKTSGIKKEDEKPDGKIRRFRNKSRGANAAGGVLVVGAGGTAGALIGSGIERLIHEPSMAVDAANAVGRAAEAIVNSGQIGTVGGGVVGGLVALKVYRGSRGESKGGSDMNQSLDTLVSLQENAGEDMTKYLRIVHGIHLNDYSISREVETIDGQEYKVANVTRVDNPRTRGIEDKVKGVRTMLEARSAYYGALGYPDDPKNPRPKQLFTRPNAEGFAQLDTRWDGLITDKFEELGGEVEGDPFATRERFLKARAAVTETYMRRAIEAGGAGLGKPMAQIEAGVDRLKNEKPEEIVKRLTGEREANELHIAQIEQEKAVLQGAIVARETIIDIDSTITNRWGSEAVNNPQEVIDSLIAQTKIDDPSEKMNEEIITARKNMSDAIAQYNDPEYLKKLVESSGVRRSEIPNTQSRSGEKGPRPQTQEKRIETAPEMTPEAIADKRSKEITRLQQEIDDLVDRQTAEQTKWKNGVKQAKDDLEELRGRLKEKDVAKRALASAQLQESLILAALKNPESGLLQKLVGEEFTKLIEEADAAMVTNGTPIPENSELRKDMEHQIRGLAYNNVSGRLLAENLRIDGELAEVQSGSGIESDKAKKIKDGEAVIQIGRDMGKILTRTTEEDEADMRAMTRVGPLKESDRGYTDKERAAKIASAQALLDPEREISDKSRERALKWVSPPRSYYEMLNLMTDYQNAAGEGGRSAAFETVSAIITPDLLAEYIREAGVIAGLDESSNTAVVYNALQAAYDGGGFTPRDLRRLMSSVVNSLVKDTSAKY